MTDRSEALSDCTDCVPCLVSARELVLSLELLGTESGPWEPCTEPSDMLSGDKQQ